MLHINLFFFASVCLSWDIVNTREPKKTVYMDRSAGCNVGFYDDRLSEGDTYQVKSERQSPDGPSTWHVRQRVAYCHVSFDFGSRLVAVVVDMWRCDRGVSDNDASLAIYGDCRRDNSSTNLLSWLNCSMTQELHALSVYSPKSCISVLFRRGVVNTGSHFELTVVARYEAFPAYKLAAIIVSSMVLLMLLVKLFCVLSGCERRLPNMPLDIEEHVHILNEDMGPPILINGNQESDHYDLTEDTFQYTPVHMNRHASPSHAGILSGCSPVTGRSSHENISAELPTDPDYDFLDSPSTSRLKTYIRTKSSIWRT